MSVLTYDQLIEPILRFLAAVPERATARGAHDTAANALNLSETQRDELIASGQPTYKNRGGWAHDRMKRTGLIEQRESRLLEARWVRKNICHGTSGSSECRCSGTASDRLYGSQAKKFTSATPSADQEQIKAVLRCATAAPQELITNINPLAG